MIEMNRRGGNNKVKVQDYIEKFKWDIVRFEMNKPLGVLGAKIAQT
jgi:hypothetical protein